MMKNSFQVQSEIKFPPAGSVQRWLIYSVAFSCLLLVVRMFVKDSYGYIFLPWNLFLGFIPYWITDWIIKRGVRMKKRYIVIALGAWLVFVPNSFYILTDLFHLTKVNSAPIWFDLLLIFSFAWNGIVVGIISFRRVEWILAKVWRKNLPFIIVIALMWIIALGIYIGRYWRYNSWDIVTEPFPLAKDLAEIVLHPIANIETWGMTMVYGIFMTLLYFTVKKLGEGLIRSSHTL